MTACKHFIIGIQQINFATEPAKRLQQVLLAYALKDLNTEEQSQQELLSQLPETIEGNPIANKQLALVKEKIGSQIKSIQSRIGNIRKEASQLGIDLDAEIELDDVFIEIFADNFRNIPHLDETLSDAPPEIKAIQTKLYSVVLSKLDQKEQEQQLASLSTANIQDMVNQALLTYQTSKEPALKTKSQHLIQMGIFELIHRESIKLTEARHPDYLAFTRKLHHLLPEVGNSDVIDELSEYQNSDGQTISKLLFAVSEALHLQHHPWDSDEQIESAKEIRALFHKLRFGQSDRREYIEKRKANMQRDLLWARTIQDTELFTISDESEREFHKLEELRILNHDRKFKIHSEVKNRVFPKQKLEMAFREAFRQRKDAKLPLGIKSNPLVQGTKAYTQVLKILEDAFQAEIEKPVITVGQDGKIKAAFFYLDTPIQTILNAILDGGGFGRSPESIARTAFDLEAIKRSIVTHSFEGETLAEIESQIQFPEDETIKHSFTEALNNVKQSVPSRTISDLQLGLSEELLLRKLLELHRFYSYSPPSPESLTTIFSELERAPMDALKLSDLEQTVSQHFIILAEKNEEDVPLEVRSIVRKAKTMLMSNAERIRKIETFHAAFESTAATNSMLKALFRDEYQAMSQTLKLSAEEIVEMNQDMDAMIDEFLLLHERTKGGQPVLSKPEEEAYFSVVKQIAEEIKPKSLADYQFKILHSSHGRQEVKLTSLTGETRQVLIDIGRTKLPYSLIKPPGASELIFSYGGSRGIIAPFEGFATTHGSLKHRKRLFTHSRLLGVGQYGSVKEVEGLLTGLNRVIKEGYALTTDATPAFENQLRENLRSRPITSREDPLYRIESDILQTLSSAEQNSRDSFSGGTQYWLKEKEKKTKTLRQYQILTARAKGDTLADTASQAFNRYSKTDLAYHNPVIRPDYHNLSTLENRLALSEALVHEAEQFHALGFAHNDIKPENFLYKRDANGHYSVRFIDWATGGFERAVDPAVIPQEVATDHQLEIIFKELFGTDLTYTLGEHQCSDPQGRFVRYNPDTKGFSFGVNPTLEILHGARNGTLPYISPTVLGEERNKTGLPTGERDSTLNTRFTSNDPTMDNWALTAMTFGICNRQAYFALVRGRVLSDYVVPQVLDIADQDPQGLTIVDVEKFNQLFAVDEITAEDLATGQAYTQTDGVMYIPGNPREGEPLHLYRHLKALRAQCTQKKTPTAAEQEIIDRIDEILSTVHQAVANGKGLSKEALQEQFKKATSCIEQFQQLHNEDYLASLNQEALLNSILAKYKDKPAPSANDLLQKTTSGVSELDILFTYSKSAAQQQESLAILNNAFTSNDLENLCFNEDAPYSHLLKTGIALNQRIILQGVLSKVDADNASFYEHVHDQGLLHFSLQQGQTEVFSALIEALQKAGAEDKTIFDLLTQEYGPGQDQLPTQKHIQWSNDTFHIVIRNHNLKQLQLILDRLPEEPGYEPILLKALHQAALLSHQDCYQMLLERYNARYPDNIITPETIVATTYPPDDSSPYHLFLRDETTLGSIDWSALEANTELAKSFLLHTPANTTAFPLLITTQFSNYTGMEKLLTLGDKAGLIEEEWQALFLQTDADGKNILNHCLEQGQLQELPSILDAIRQRCGEKSTNILITLLSNPNPLNPLQNFLATEEVTTVQYRIVSELLDAISKDYTKASKPEQQARIIALLVNKVWLFEQADTNPEELRTLLQNNALSIPYKQLLFKQLTEKAPERSAAKDYFKHLLAEVSPQVSEIQERKVNLELPAILGEVTKQERGALNDLIDELTRNSGIASAVKVATLELNAKIRDIETRIAEEGRKLATTTSALHTQIARAEASETQQHSIQAELETAQTELQRLKAEALSLTTAHTAEVERLQTQIQQVSGQNEADKAELTAQLDALNAAHKIAQDAIATQLQEARDQVGGLEEKLESQAAQLAQSQHEARALSQELESLKPQYEELKTRLEQQTELSSTEQQRLSDLLEQQTRAAQEATQKTSELETRLNTT
ncbi:hypothetical protein, partial [Legionella yabuuchiae]|uniref:hypothetical protein n=1 Tax=Legionella yabuuchiae TaxID=376727 RepID=UPI001056B7D9